jgi:CBS domain-containing protein
MPRAPTVSAPAAAAQMPSASLLANFRQDLSRHPPFAQMDAPALDFFLAHCEQRYYAPGEVLAQPADGVVSQIFFIRQGAVSGVRGIADVSGGAFEYEAGDLFPVSAAMAQRAVTATYSAVADTFVLVLPCAAMRELAQRSPPFADFLNRRIAQFLELSRQALQISYASRALAEQSLETPLRQLVKRPPVSCAPGTSVREALTQMHRSHIGSILVADAQGCPIGILTRYDVLARITLAQVALDAPIRDVMVQPVHTLTEADTAQDAALLMSLHGIRHVPVTRNGVAVGLVSERDLFAMQRLSLKQVGTAIRAAADLDALKAAAQDIRRLAGSLLSQGVQARQLTALISHLNDLLTQRLLQLKAAEHAVQLGRICWLALGSEGRSEQTVATDQDNALILPDDSNAAQREAILAFARDVNLALDACGYPLCRGGIMAGEPGCCLTLSEWRLRFGSWIDHGAPQDLLDASIYFDFRALAGDETLANGLGAQVHEMARNTPRFIKQMAQNALTRSPPLNWLGAIDADARGTIDLKLQGTAIFVDAARVYALANGTLQASTRARFESAGAGMGLASSEYQAWAGGFEFLQMLRLRVQLESDATLAEPNRISIAGLNDIDRRILKESLRVARSLQQRLRLDYER